MRLLLMGNNWLAWKVTEWLKSTGENIIGVVVHPEENSRYREEIIQAADVEPGRVFDGSQLRQRHVVESVRDICPDMGLSVMFGYIMQSRYLSLFPKGCLNLHPSFLPFNRGAFPNVWSIVDDTPAGATLHYIDEDIDTGDIVAQRRVPIEPVDTGKSLYTKTETACYDLFKDNWPEIRAGRACRTMQLKNEGTTHRKIDVEDIDKIDLERYYTGQELLDILRARTFPPHSGAYFVKDRRKIYVNVELKYADDFD